MGSGERGMVVGSGDCIGEWVVGCSVGSGKREVGCGERVVESGD